MELPLAAVLEPDASIEADGFVVVVDPGDRIHFLDWGAPARTGVRHGVLAVHGLSGSAWLWAPVGRRLGGTAGLAHVVTMDLRGHGLSDAPTDDGAYELPVLAGDVVAVAEGAGLVPTAGSDLADEQVVLAGHGFGAIVAAIAAVHLGERCAGLVLVDGGWESLEASTGIDADEFLRGLDEPPEVMRSMAAFLADRRAFDPASWDDDQERAAMATVVETHAGRVVPATRPHALEACVRAMFTYEPLSVLAGFAGPIVALMSADDVARSRRLAIDAVNAARASAGHGPIAIVPFSHDGHNLMRYRPREVAAAILSLAD